MNLSQVYANKAEQCLTNIKAGSILRGVFTPWFWKVQPNKKSRHKQRNTQYPCVHYRLMRSAIEGYSLICGLQFKNTQFSASKSI